VLHRPVELAQYTSLAFGQRLGQARILGSMGTVGDALDNAVAESFFATLQVELLDRQPWQTRTQLMTAICYNQECRQTEKPCAKGVALGGHRRSFGQQGVSEGYGGLMLGQLPGQVFVAALDVSARRLG